MLNTSIAIRLQEARLMRGLSMEKLAESMGGIVSRQSIFRYETGAMNPRPSVCRSLVKALGISEEYLLGTSISLDKPMLRSTAGDSLTDDDLERLEARLSFWVERYLAKESEIGYRSDFSNPIKELVVSSEDDASMAADLLRERWRCGDGPIPSILRLLERKGIKMLDTSLPDNIWGLSTWADKVHPLIVIDMSKGKTTIDRLRFTVGHELGHLLLTFPDGMEKKRQEKLCNKFSSFFLFPKATFIAEMGSPEREAITLQELIDLKEVYGVSVAAMVHEAWDIRMISREHYDWWYDDVIKKNWLETGWGTYQFPETLGREMRVDSIVDEKQEKEKYVE